MLVYFHVCYGGDKGYFVKYISDWRNVSKGRKKKALTIGTMYFPTSGENIANTTHSVRIKIKIVVNIQIITRYQLLMSMRTDQLNAFLIE